MNDENYRSTVTQMKWGVGIRLVLQYYRAVIAETTPTSLRPHPLSYRVTVPHLSESETQSSVRLERGVAGEGLRASSRR